MHLANRRRGHPPTLYPFPPLAAVLASQRFACQPEFLFRHRATLHGGVGVIKRRRDCAGRQALALRKLQDFFRISTKARFVNQGWTLFHRTPTRSSYFRKGREVPCKADQILEYQKVRRPGRYARLAGKTEAMLCYFASPIAKIRNAAA